MQVGGGVFPLTVSVCPVYRVIAALEDVTRSCDKGLSLSTCRTCTKNVTTLWTMVFFV